MDAAGLEERALLRGERSDARKGGRGRGKAVDLEHASNVVGFLLVEAEDEDAILVARGSMVLVKLVPSQPLPRSSKQKAPAPAASRP
eukprot:429352-Hanusia_phi.AAC.1